MIQGCRSIPSSNRFAPAFLAQWELCIGSELSNKGNVCEKKTAIVTGASRDIGTGSVGAFVKEVTSLLGTIGSVLAVASFCRINQLLRIIADAVLKDDLHLFNIGNRCSWITFDDHKVRIFPDANGSDLVLLAQIDCPV